MLRVIDKQTKEFIRDDFEYNEETEIALEVDASQGFYKPKWNCEAWEEGATQEYIDSLKAQATPTEPTMETLIEAIVNKVVIHDTKIVTLEETIDVLYRGV